MSLRLAYNQFNCHLHVPLDEFVEALEKKHRKSWFVVITPPLQRAQDANNVLDTAPLQLGYHPVRRGHWHINQHVKEAKERHCYLIFNRMKFQQTSCGMFDFPWKYACYDLFIVHVRAATRTIYLDLFCGVKATTHRNCRILDLAVTSRFRGDRISTALSSDWCRSQSQGRVSIGQRGTWGQRRCPIRWRGVGLSYRVRFWGGCNAMTAHASWRNYSRGYSIHYHFALFQQTSKLWPTPSVIKSIVMVNKQRNR